MAVLGTAATALLVFIGCYAGASLGVQLRFPDTGTAIFFPPYAVLATALLLSPVRVWWLLLLAAAAGNFVPHQVFEASPSFVALAEVANASRALIVAAGVRLITGRTKPFATFREMTVFLSLGAVIGPLVAAFVGATDVVLHNPGTDFWGPWRAWLISNMVTGVTLLPLLFLLATTPLGSLRAPRARRWIEAIAMAAGFLSVAVLVAESERPSLAAMVYGPLPFLIWAVVRFGPAGTVATLCTFAGVTVRSALNGQGPFIGASQTETLLDLQLFLVAVSVPILLLTALIQEHAQATAALRESRARYQTVVEDQTELICRIRPDGTYTFVNDAYCRYFQSTREQLLGTTFWRFVPESDWEGTRALFSSITPETPVRSHEHQVFAPGAVLRWQHWTNRGFFDESGRIIEFQAVGRDVTDRHRAEEALRENEERLALAISSAHLGVWDWNLATGTATCSEEMRRIFGWDDIPCGAPLETFLDMVHPADRGPVRHAFEGSRAQLSAFEVEYRIAHPDGGERWVAATGQTFPDREGNPHRVVALNRDVTTRKRAEEEIRVLEQQRVLLANEQGFRSLADNAPVLIWRSGLWNEGIYFNKKWLDFTGRSLERELGFGWVESVHPDDRKYAQDICDAAFAGRQPMTMQLRLRRHDGEYRWVLDNGVPYLGAGGEFTGYVGTCVDITDRHLAEETLQEADRHKDEFLAMLGHELRNPLAPIGAAVEVLRKSSTDPSVVWARDAISRQLRQLNKLVDDLVDVSRIARNQIELNLAPLDLAQVIPSAVEASRPLIAARDHQLSITLPNEPLPVRGDLVRLVQVVSNLLNNAANYTERGGRITLTVAREGPGAVLKVVDNGTGIPPEMLQRVFDMFTQLSSQRDRSQGGLGIGLTLAKRLVEGHGGTIDARSEGANKGSEFTVRLPLTFEAAVAPSPADASSGADTAGSRRDGTRTRILIVDDNVDAAEGLSRVLRGHEHEIRVVHDGLAALSATESMRPHVVLLDIGLPEIDGLEVARRIRAREMERTPFLVAMTGFGQPEVRRRTMEAGFDDHLTKPFDLDRLNTILQMEAARRMEGVASGRLPPEGRAQSERSRSAVP